MVLVLASVALMTVDHRHQHLDTVRDALAVLVHPLRLLVDLPASTGDWLDEALATRRELQEENASLRTQHRLLKAQIQKLDALEAENRRLRALLDSSFKVGERVEIAELLSVDLDPYRHQVLIDKGARDGIYTGQPVLDAEGVMGQTIEVNPFTATVILITDPSHAIPVQVNRNGLRTVALGTGAINRLELPHIPVNADIRPGDLLVSSGLGGRFPADYPVARVTAVERLPGRSFARVAAAPVARLDRSREVLLVRPGREPATPPADDSAGDAAEAAP